MARKSNNSAEFPIGELLGEQYRVLSALGKGNMGAVYVAQDERLKRRVAVKVLESAGLSDEHRKAGFLPRFEQEAVLAASLSHPASR